MRHRRVTWRDRLAHRICNFALQHIASDWYEAFIEGSIRYGCEAAARDVRETTFPTQERD